jgi:hypothetical protein
VNNDPVNWVDLWGYAPIYGDDIQGKPVVAYSGRDLKAETSIVIQRNSADKAFNDTLSVNIGSQTIFKAPVQSEANIPEPKLTKEHNGQTLTEGSYTGTLKSTSPSYLNAILIEDPDFYIHPNEVTNLTKQMKNIEDGINNGPFYNQVSAGCQVLYTPDFNDMTSTLQGVGFKYDGTETIDVIIKDDPAKKGE